MKPRVTLFTPTSKALQSYPWGDYFEDSAPEIGRYAVTYDAEERLTHEPELISKLVSGIMEARLDGETRAAVIFEGLPPYAADQHNWTVSIAELLSRFPANPTEMFGRALVNLSRSVKWPGDQVALNGIRARLLFGENYDQTTWMLRQLKALGYVQYEDVGDMESLPTITIEIDGWKQINELQRKPSRNCCEAFVAMSFQEDMRQFFEEGIKPAVEADKKTKCVRIDGIQHNNKICDEIIAAIRRSRYVIADFTGNRGGVYYEAGFAHGLGLPVIWTVKGTADDLHFDTRQYNHIVYNTADELRLALLNRIAATIP